MLSASQIANFHCQLTWNLMGCHHLVYIHEAAPILEVTPLGHRGIFDDPKLVADVKEAVATIKKAWKP